MVFDLVAQDQVGAGVAGPGLADLVAEGGEGLGSPGRGERVEADEQFAVAGDDVAGDDQGFADEGAGLVFGAGVAAVQGAGQGGLGVVCGHPDGVGDLPDLGLRPRNVGGDVAEPGPGRDGRRGVLGGGKFAYAASTGALRALAIWLVRQDTWPGAGLRSSSSRASRAASAVPARASARRTWAAAAFFAGFGTIRSRSSGEAAWESRTSRAKRVRA